MTKLAHHDAADAPLTVLKFGSSILRTEADLPLAVHEIYRWVRKGHRVLAVVSALAGQTDALLERARRVAAHAGDAGADGAVAHDGTAAHDEDAVAALLATGEETSAALLKLALARAGIPAALLDARRAGLRTRGTRLDAEPCGLDAASIRLLFEDVPVVVLPGFVGVGPAGEPTLLGRGGSDLTAIYAAWALEATHCRFAKDVGGVFDRDPKDARARTNDQRPAPDHQHSNVGAELARPGELARPDAAACYETLAWRDALALGAKVVQAKALAFAARHRIAFEVAGLGEDARTTVNEGPSRFRRPAPSAAAATSGAPLRVALLGLGTVGLGVYRALAARPDRYEIVGVAVRDLAKHRFDGVPRELFSTDPWEVASRPADLVIELLGGTDPAGDLVAAALAAGRDVVTANKAVLAHRGAEFEVLARRTGARLHASAAAGGVVPVLEYAQRLGKRGRGVALEAVLNGTTNFVLDRLAAGTRYDDAVAAAQAAGFAEADPTLDLDGSDAAQKLALAARALFRVEVDWSRIARRGLDTLDHALPAQAAREGKAVRLVARAERTADGIALSVAPEVLPQAHPLARLVDEENGVIFRTTGGATLRATGKGAGRWPTTEAVVADVEDLFRRRATRTVADQATGAALA